MDSSTAGDNDEHARDLNLLMRGTFVVSLVLLASEQNTIQKRGQSDGNKAQERVECVSRSSVVHLPVYIHELLKCPSSILQQTLRPLEAVCVQEHLWLQKLTSLISHGVDLDKFIFSSSPSRVTTLTRLNSGTFTPHG